MRIILKLSLSLSFGITVGRDKICVLAHYSFYSITVFFNLLGGVIFEQKKSDTFPVVANCYSEPDSKISL